MWLNPDNDLANEWRRCVSDATSVWFDVFLSPSSNLHSFIVISKTLLEDNGGMWYCSYVYYFTDDP